ncbi:MAG: hypothetical protein R6U38_02235 [Desulfatiglandaceae bacterium]
MNTRRILTAGFIASTLFIAPVFAEETGIKRHLYSPPPETYQQISQEEARKMKNYIPSDQKEAVITLEYISEKNEVKKNH